MSGAALVDEIAATLHSRVMRGEIPAGARLRQEVLAADFGVSRTPVREALRKLQAAGIVDLAPNRGAVVRGPTAREIREAYVVRAELEGLAAGLAATLILVDQLERLRESVDEFRACVDSGAGIELRARANDTFHQLIQEAAGNERLRATLADLHKSYPRDLTALVYGENNWQLDENVEQHAQILAAIEAHDPAAARARMIEHVERAGELIVLRFEQRAG